MNREVTKEEGDQLAREHEATHFQVSAKLGTNVNNLFLNIASTLPGAEISQMMSPATRNLTYLNIIITCLIDSNAEGQGSKKGNLVLNTGNAQSEDDKKKSGGCC